jgi:hypothetical protein
VWSGSSFLLERKNPRGGRGGARVWLETKKCAQVPRAYFARLPKSYISPSELASLFATVCIFFQDFALDDVECSFLGIFPRLAVAAGF